MQSPPYLDAILRALRTLPRFVTAIEELPTPGDEKFVVFSELKQIFAAMQLYSGAVPSTQRFVEQFLHPEQGELRFGNFFKALLERLGEAWIGLRASPAQINELLIGEWTRNNGQNRGFVNPVLFPLDGAPFTEALKAHFANAKISLAPQYLVVRAGPSPWQNSGVSLGALNDFDLADFVTTDDRPHYVLQAITAIKGVPATYIRDAGGWLLVEEISMQWSSFESGMKKILESPDTEFVFFYARERESTSPRERSNSVYSWRSEEAEPLLIRSSPKTSSTLLRSRARLQNSSEPFTPPLSKKKSSQKSVSPGAASNSPSRSGTPDAISSHETPSLWERTVAPLLRPYSQSSSARPRSRSPTPMRIADGTVKEEFASPLHEQLQTVFTHVEAAEAIGAPPRCQGSPRIDSFQLFLRDTLEEEQYAAVMRVALFTAFLGNNPLLDSRGNLGEAMKRKDFARLFAQFEQIHGLHVNREQLHADGLALQRYKDLALGVLICHHVSKLAGKKSLLYLQTLHWAVHHAKPDSTVAKKFFATAALNVLTLALVRKQGRGPVSDKDSFCDIALGFLTIVNIKLGLASPAEATLRSACLISSGGNVVRFAQSQDELLEKIMDDEDFREIVETIRYVKTLTMSKALKINLSIEGQLRVAQRRYEEGDYPLSFKD